jgi:hypothetical protein
MDEKKKGVLYVRDKDLSLTVALDREMARRASEGIPLPDRQALIKETLWTAIRLWEDARRGGKRIASS